MHCYFIQHCAKEDNSSCAGATTGEGINNEFELSSHTRQRRVVKITTTGLKHP